MTEIRRDIPMSHHELKGAIGNRMREIGEEQGRPFRSFSAALKAYNRQYGFLPPCLERAPEGFFPPERFDNR